MQTIAIRLDEGTIARLTAAQDEERAAGRDPRALHDKIVNDGLDVLRGLTAAPKAKRAPRKRAKPARKAK